MLPCDYGSAHSRAPESTSAVPSVPNSEESSKAFKGTEKPIVKRSINFDADTSSGRDSLPEHLSACEMAETFKRRCAVPDITQQFTSRQDLRSDFVRALFNPTPSDIAGGLAQTMEYMSRPVPAMATSFGPSASCNYTSCRSSHSSSIGVNGSASNDALTSPGGHLNDAGKHASSNAVVFSRSTSQGVGVFGVPFTPQPTGFQIPGLGAPFRPVDPDDSKKTRVSSPGVARPRQAGSHTRITAGPQSVLSPVLESAPEFCPNPAAQLQHKDKPRVASNGPAVTNRKPSLAKHNSSNAAVLTPSKAATTPKHASAGAGAAPKEVSATACPSGLVRIPKHLRPTGHADVWTERQSYRTFRLNQIQNDTRRFETFDGAYQILSGLNPDHYSMPYGSMVVAIKCPSLDDILISHITGLWATNQNVMGRIMELHENREDTSEKTLFLWSMPGSKHFCGLAELQGFDPAPRSEIYDKEAGRNVTIVGALMVQWKYCKLVPFEDVVPAVEGKIDQGSVTQMWNGIYNEATGREVVKSYVEAPHVENMLAAPAGEFFRRAMENSKVATVPPSAPRFPTRGGYRSQQRGGHALNQSARGGGNNLLRRGNYQNSKAQIRPQPAHQSATMSVPVVKEESVGAKHTTQTNSASPENKRNRGQPQLHMMPVLKYADGSITTAPNMRGSITSIAPHRSVAGTQNVCAHESNSAIQTKSVTLNSSNVPDVMHTPVTMGTSFPSQGQIADHLSGSVFNVSASVGNHSYSFAMPFPRKPSMSQQVAASQSEDPESSTPRTLASLDRYRTNINSWSYYGSPEKTSTQPKTPVKQPNSSYDLAGSPMDIIKHRTPTLCNVPSSLGSNHVSPQNIEAYSYGQLPPKLRTPDSSPIEVRLKSSQSGQSGQPVLPVTPRPARGRVAAEQLDEDGHYNPTWIHMLVDDE
ncbi:hypothetical protein E4T39_05911 [Aureobasidium subglaciale]|nr:hypothetical protein E4T39_05911 [Aureobasidium subglaciale]